MPPCLANVVWLSSPPASSTLTTGVLKLPTTYQRFIDGLHASVDDNSLRTVVAEALAAFDLHRFTYFSPAMPRRRSALFLSTYPSAWTDHYFANGYDAVDPVFQIAATRGAPIVWGKDAYIADQTDLQKQLFDEAAHFGICAGLTLPIADDQFGFAAMTVVAEEGAPSFERWIWRPLPVVQFMAAALHSALRRKAWSSRMVAGVYMTKRELECLRWCAEGKSLRDVADILGIGRRTAVHHLERAKAKLGVRSVCQAVALYAAANG